MGYRIALPDIYGTPSNLAAGLRWTTHSSSESLFPRIKYRVLEGGGITYKVDRGAGDSVVQIGLVSRNDRVFGAYSAAALLAASHPEETFLVVLPVHSGNDDVRYWLGGVEEGQIIPGTDIVNSLENIEAARAEVAAVFGEIPILAPVRGEYFGASQQVEDSFYFDPAVIASMRPIGRYTLKAQIAALAAFGAIYYGVNSYQVHQDRKEALAIMESKRELSRKQIKTVQELQQEALQEEWVMLSQMLSQPPFHHTAKQIAKHAADLPFIVPGWKAVSAVYTPLESQGEINSSKNTMALVFNREGGSFKGLIDALPYSEEQIQIAPDGSKAIVIVPLELAAPELPSRDLLDADGRRRLTVMDSLRNSALSVNIGNPARVERPRELSSKAVAPDKYFVTDVRRYDMKVSGRGIRYLAEIAETLSQYSAAIQVKNVVLRYDTNYAWTIKADYYE